MEWGQGPPGPPGPGPGGWGQGPPSGPGWDGPPPGPGWGGPPGPCGPGWGPNPNDVEYVDADEQRPGSKMANAFCLCCVGILLFPVALMVLGYNEVNSVCTHEKILYGQKMAEVIGCEPRNAWYQNMVVYMSCPVHEDSLQVFTPASFNSMGLQDAISFRSTSGSQKAEMYQCVETYRTEKTRDKETIKIYSYSMEWKSQPVDSSHFAYNGQAQAARDQGCPYFRQVGNPSWPADLPQSSSQNYAQSVRAGPLTIGHRLIAGEDSILGGLEPNQRVQLSSFASRFRPFNQLAPHPPAGGFVSITPQMAAIDPSGQYIVTCAAPTIGCLRISYKKNSATTLSVLSGVEGGYTKPIEVPSSWGCSPGQFDALIGKPMSLTQFAGKFEETNSTNTWMMRVLGLGFVVITVYCCFSPISAGADVIGDFLRCLPCVGGFLEDLLEGMVDTLVWIVSCAVGCSCGLLVIAIVWVAMRPQVGAGLLLVCLVLGCCAYAIAQQHKKNRDSNRISGKDEEGGFNSYDDDSDDE